MAEFYSLSMAVEEVKEKGFGSHQVEHKHISTTYMAYLVRNQLSSNMIYIYKRLICKVSPWEFGQETGSSITSYDMH